jgi:hypothetical protein
VERGPWLRRAAQSEWALDRIILYRYLADEGPDRMGSEVDARSAVRHVDTELERARSHKGNVSLIPLYYSLRLLKATIRPGLVPPDIQADLTPLLEEIERFVVQDSRRDGDRRVRNLVRDVRAHVTEPASRSPTSATPPVTPASV